MTPLGNKLDEEITLRGITTLAILLGNSTLWGERYFAEIFDDNFAGDTVDVGSVNRLRWG